MKHCNAQLDTTDTALSKMPSVLIAVLSNAIIIESLLQHQSAHLRRECERVSGMINTTLMTGPCSRCLAPVWTVAHIELVIM